MKDKIVGSWIGALALQARGWLDLRSISFRNPEKASLVANFLISDRLITHLPADGSAFLDIGGHVGSVFSEVHRINPSVRCMAIEADAGKAARLSARFDYCTVHNCAVGEEAGTATFYLQDQSGYNSLVEREGGTAVEVEIRQLDQMFETEEFDTIKIDIEGAELGALRGGHALLERSRPTVMFESAGLSKNSLGYAPDMLWSWFDENGFGVFTPDRVAHDCPPLTLEAFLDAHHYPMRTHNFFAIAQERREEIRDKARRILAVANA